VLFGVGREVRFECKMASFEGESARIIEKFNGENFNLWKFKMEMVLASMDLWEIVDGSEEAPPSNADPKVIKEYQRRAKKAMSIIGDALPSPGVNPLEGSPMWCCGIGIQKGAPDFQHYRGVEGRAKSPEIRLGRGTSRSSLNLHSKTNHTGLVSHSGTPLGVGTSHGHFGPQDSPRPRLGGSHHLPPYSILCNAPSKLHPNGSFSRDSQVGVPKLSRNCPGWSPGTLGTHNSRL
jgi:hypothetical protein